MDFLQHFLQDAITPSRESKPKVQEFIYRDELHKKKTAPVRIKKKVHFESKALLQRDKNKKYSETGNEKDEIAKGLAVNGEKSGIQVKILMTKEEAVRLLSKCKGGGVLEFKDVANELVQIPSDRVNVHVSSNKKRHMINLIQS